MSQILTRTKPTTDNFQALLEKIQTKQAKVGIVGLGYVGLPLASLVAHSGFLTLGIEADFQKRAQLEQGRSYIGDIDSSTIHQLVSQGMLSVSDWEGAKDLDVVVLCVPTPFNKNKEPDLSYVTQSLTELVKMFKSGMLVVLESSTYPGTTEEILLPALEATGLRVGQDFYLAYSPERVDPGNPLYKTQDIPRVVGGVTKKCGELASAFYSPLVSQVIQVSSPRAAEMAKLLENIFRNVNIALVNELAMLCDRIKIDIWEVIEAAATKPFGFMKFLPGPGVGGHCIPVDPIYLSWKAKEYDFYTNFINLAAEVNSNMPYFVVRKLVRLLRLNNGSSRDWKVLILGVTFKKDVADIRTSSALKLMELLREEGIAVFYHDPYIRAFPIGSETIESIDLNKDNITRFDCVVIHTDHSSYDWDWVVHNSKLVFDTRNATKNVTMARDKIYKL